MALPPPQSSSPSAPSPARASPRPRWILPAALVAVGVVLGVVIGAIVFRGGGGDADAPEGGAADAAAGCDLSTRLPEEIPERPSRDDGWGLEGPHVWRLQAVSGAFAAAATQDRAYRAPGEAAERLWRAYQTFSLEDANEALATIRTWCVDNAADG